MRVPRAYMSRTGNTKKVAEAIFGEIPGEKKMKSIDEVASLEGYDLAFLGFPVRLGSPPKKARAFLERQTRGKKVALFITHAAPEDHYSVPPNLAELREAASGASALDLFDCQGQLAAVVKFLMRLLRNAEVRAWARQDDSQWQPDAMRLERARAFARESMARAAWPERSRRVGT